MVTVQICSDIHLELGPRPLRTFLKPSADVLVLAGDIGDPFRGSYGDLLRTASTSFSYVLVCAGNHEYYNYHEAESEIEPQIQSQCDRFENVIFLNRRSWSHPTHPNIVFVGCTLWSELPPHSWRTVRRFSDFDRITIRRKPLVKFAPDIYNSWHKRDRKWLENTLTDLTGSVKKVVVVTHHVPSFRLETGDHPFTPLTRCWHAPCDDLIGPPVALWLFGHTHENMDVTIDGTRCVSNCLGYIDEQLGGAKFDGNQVIKVAHVAHEECTLK